MKFYSITRTGTKSWNVGYFDEANVFHILETVKTFPDASNKADDLNRTMLTEIQKELTALRPPRSPLPGDTVDLARFDYAELWERYVPMRDAVIELVDAWGKAGCYGFVCRGQDDLHLFLCAIGKLKELV